MQKQKYTTPAHSVLLIEIIDLTYLSDTCYSDTNTNTDNEIIDLTYLSDTYYSETDDGYFSHL